MLVCATLGLSAELALADAAAADPCRVRIGHERPEGCAPVRPRAVREGVPRRVVRRTAAPPDEASFRAIREPKHWASRKQSTRLLMRELHRLERLLAVTPKRSPERARIVRRLADGYAELEQLAAVERIRAELNLERAKARARAGSP
ncbi:MAG TPA: hypothetical protein VI197_25575 [Polyangiaceae bacterium]